MRREKFDICLYCGDHIDKGEICDCRWRKQREQNRMEQMVKTTESGQLAFNFSEMKEEAVLRHRLWN